MIVNDFVRSAADGVFGVVARIDNSVDATQPIDGIVAIRGRDHIGAFSACVVCEDMVPDGPEFFRERDLCGDVANLFFENPVAALSFSTGRVITGCHIASRGLGNDLHQGSARLRSRQIAPVDQYVGIRSQCIRPGLNCVQMIGNRAHIQNLIAQLNATFRPVRHEMHRRNVMQVAQSGCNLINAAAVSVQQDCDDFSVRIRLVL